MKNKPCKLAFYEFHIQVTFLFYNLQEKMAVMDEMEQRLASSNSFLKLQTEQNFTVQSVLSGTIDQYYTLVLEAVYTLKE